MWIVGRDERKIDSLYDGNGGPSETSERIFWVLSGVESGGIVVLENGRVFVGAKNIVVDVEKNGRKGTLIPAQKEVKVLESNMGPGLRLWVGGEEIPFFESVRVGASIGRQMPKFAVPKIDGLAILQRIKWKLAAPIDPELRKKTRKTMYIGLGFLLLTGVIIGVGGWRRADTELKQSAEYVAVEEMWTDFGEAKAVLGIDPKKAREEFVGLKSRLETYSGPDVENRIQTMKQELPGLLETANGVSKKELEEILDLGLVRDGMKVSSIAKLGTKIVGLDTDEGRLVEIDVVKKSAAVLTGGFENALIMTVYVNRTSVVDKKGVVEYPGMKQRIASDQVEGMVDMGSFAGNIYTVDAGGEVWRFAAIESGYSPRAKWIAEGETRMEQVRSMAIDGSVWLTNTAAINKYTRGAKDSFGISGFEGELGPAPVIFTDEETEKLYVLDSASGRIVVFGKTGEYEKQIKNDGLKNVTDLVVLEKEGKIYLASGSKIYSINI